MCCPQEDAQQNFRIFWVGMHSWGIIHHFVAYTIKSVIFKQLLYLPDISANWQDNFSFSVRIWSISLIRTSASHLASEALTSEADNDTLASVNLV